MSEKATPRPWRVKIRDIWWSVEGSNGEEVFDDGTAGAEYMATCSEANRDLIVAAVNSYDAHRTLVKAAMEVLMYRVSRVSDADFAARLAALRTALSAVEAAEKAGAA